MKLIMSVWLALQVLVLAFLDQCNADLTKDLLAGFENASDCVSCRSLLVPMKALAHRGDDDLVDGITSVCKTLKLADDDVCAGTYARLGPIYAHSLRTFDVFGQTAAKFCNAFAGLCSFPPVDPYKVPFPKRAPTHPKRWVSTGKRPFQVVHFSDVHIDRQYTVGADANCTKNICCRKYADHKGPITEPAEPLGNPKCDSPPALASSMLDAIGKLASTSRFSIFTGDVVQGDVWIEDENEGKMDLIAWNAQMAAKVRVPVYGTFGNHDSAPVNSYPPDITGANVQWLYDTQAAGWKRWINTTAADELRHTSGSYAVIVPGTKLRIISMNTNYWYKQNFWLYHGEKTDPDPNGLLAFMVSQLQAAEDAGQRAWIIGHIPPGKEDTIHDQSNYYDQILQRYINTISGQFFGHSHKDQFEIAYSDWNHRNADTAVAVAHIGPALTPTSGNPAYKTYDIDPDTYEVMDVKVYMTNVSAPGFQKDPKWELYYSARESYGPMVGKIKATEPLDASFWHKLTEVFEKDDKAFQLWNTRISRGGAVTACTGDCKTVAICDQRSLRSENNCDEAPPTAASKRDAPDTRLEEDECEGAGTSIFKNLLSGRVTGVPGANADVKERIRQVISSREQTN